MYKLATGKTDQTGLTCGAAEVQQPIADELLGLFKKYEGFKRWTADVGVRASGYRQKGRT